MSDKEKSEDDEIKIPEEKKDNEEKDLNMIEKENNTIENEEFKQIIKNEIINKEKEVKNEENKINEEEKDKIIEDDEEKEKKEENINIINDENINTDKEKEDKEENKNIINNNSINVNEKKKEEKDEINNINNINIDEENNQNKIIEKDFSKDIMSKKYETRDDDCKYLVQMDEEQELENLINEHNNNSSDEDDEEEESFPFRLIGDIQKKGDTFGKFNHRYLEIDCVKGLLKRYKSSKEYPKHPLEVIPIKNLKSLKKLAKDMNKDSYELEIKFLVDKGKKQVEKTQIYRVRHTEIRSKWYDALLSLWKYLVKDESISKINNHKLLFLDDQAGIIQDIKQHNDKSKAKSGKVTLRNFKILGLLGIGGFSSVFKVRHILTEKIYAMKVMNKNYIISKKYLHYVVSEFEIMKSLSGFPFVLDLHYCFQSANYLYMIIDYCPNGDFTNLKCLNNLQLFLAEVILAFEHIHKHNTVYRDLKPENIILDEEGHIKICDFNLAKAGITQEKKATSFCGSPMYLSPEMVTSNGVDQRCDIYGIGLILYELVTGSPAFTAEDINQLYIDIKNNRINFKMPTITGDVKDLLKKILVADPDKRISLEEMKKHPFFKDISFLKVYKKEYGPILIKKSEKKQKIRDPVLIGDKYFEKIDDEKKKENEKMKKMMEKDSYLRFKQDQLKLDEDKTFSFLDGKISVKEMKKDLKRDMKNYVREFYFVKKEDLKQNEDFKLTVNIPLDNKKENSKKDGI